MSHNYIQKSLDVSQNIEQVLHIVPTFERFPNEFLRFNTIF